MDGQPAAFHSVDGKDAAEAENAANHDPAAGTNGSEHRRGFAEARKSEGLLKTSSNVNDEPTRVTLSQSERKKDRHMDAEGEVGEGRQDQASPERANDDLDEVSESDL